MRIDTSFVESRLHIMDAAMEQLQGGNPDKAIRSISQDVCAREFERILEQSGKLVRKRLAQYFASNRKADTLTFRDCFRHATKHGIIDCATCERWLEYRDHIDQMDSNETIPDNTLQLLSQFSADARTLAATIKAAAND